MKNIIKSIGLVTLIGFSFFYTDKVMMVVKEQDEIMIKIEEVKENYKVESVDAIIIDNTIVPGLKGKEVDVDKSYKQMRQLGVFNENYLEYKEVIPSTSVNDYYDKYITKGNSKRHQVSLIFIFDNDNLLEDTLNILSKNQVIANFFIDYDYLNEIEKITNHNLYSYGMNGNYSYENLLYSLNIIENKTKKPPKYCLSLEEDNNTLLTCSSYKMHTIIPSIIDNGNIYSNLKNNITNGSIIQININSQNLNSLNNIINFIKGKGYEIVDLNTLLSE